MNLGELIGEDPMLEARRVWARRGNKVVQKFRCTAGWRKGRLVATPSSCSKPLDVKKRFSIKRTRARLGPRIVRKTRNVLRRQIWLWTYFDMFGVVGRRKLNK